ncbi:unnamed protein product [Medioppia subpectinata]|uniref:Uncharacterized protein n=1 Tax=Medioppia subpectinata TaxID=1979941 RepID=A0A7R9LAR8_9ACAR|nr:unnamed protein product [Medioppia subpectinata]CAG2116957.1 unnamed protein product [Medioppia subpectinata]
MKYSYTVFALCLINGLASTYAWDAWVESSGDAPVNYTIAEYKAFIAGNLTATGALLVAAEAQYVKHHLQPVADFYVAISKLGDKEIPDDYVRIDKLTNHTLQLDTYRKLTEGVWQLYATGVKQAKERAGHELNVTDTEVILAKDLQTLVTDLSNYLIQAAKNERAKGKVFWPEFHDRVREFLNAQVTVFYASVKKLTTTDIRAANYQQLYNDLHLLLGQ